MYDTHVHSTFSHDGKSSVEDYIQVIGEGCLQGIGFTEHVDFMPECGGYGVFDYEAYRAAVDGYKVLNVNFHAGAEIDYAKRVEQDIKKYLDVNHFDYTICSVHMINGISISDGRSTEQLRDGNALKNMLEGYYYEVKSSLESDMFDVMGHMGIFRRYLGDDLIGHSDLSRWTSEVEIELARACAKSDKIIEVNTSGLFSPAKSTFPRFAFLKAYFDYGGRKISIGSDAHSISFAGRGFNDAMGLLKDMGFKYVTLPWDKERPLNIEER